MQTCYSSSKKTPCVCSREVERRGPKAGSVKVITPVDEPTELVNQIVVAVLKSSELRASIDPSVLKREPYQIPVIDDLLPDLTDASVFTKVNLASAV